MRLKNRVMVIISASLASLTVMGLFGLYTMRQSVMEEREAQIVQLLDFADSQLRYFHALELNGHMNREVAQARAMEAISAQRQDSNYFFIRSLTDDRFIYHPIAARMGTTDDGGRMPDGKSTAQAYRDALARSPNNKAFVRIHAPKPDVPDKQFPKMNGVMKFEPWGWMPGTGFYIDDIEARFWRQAAVFLIVGSVLLALVAILVLRMRVVILRQLGGEPHDAAEYMKKIANGDLAVEIPVGENDNDSLMASLKLMQLKLINMTSSIQENASALSSQVSTFEETAKDYAEAKSDEVLGRLLLSVKRLGKTAGILEKSTSRFKF